MGGVGWSADAGGLEVTARLGALDPDVAGLEAGLVWSASDGTLITAVLPLTRLPLAVSGA
jgi:hypothetical protein